MQGLEFATTNKNKLYEAYKEHQESFDLKFMSKKMFFSEMKRNENTATYKYFYADENTIFDKKKNDYTFTFIVAENKYL